MTSAFSLAFWCLSWVVMTFTLASAEDTVASDECSSDDTSQEISWSPANVNKLFKLLFHRTIPSSFENIIIILGQCLHSDSLNHGQAEPMLYDRIDAALSLLTGGFRDYDLELSTTAFYVSGGDVSNGRTDYNRAINYNESDPDLLFNGFAFNHATEGEVITNYLMFENRMNIQISIENIFWDLYARNTIENFYYFFRLMQKSQLKKVQRIFVVTADFHMARSLYIFNTLNKVWYYNETLENEKESQKTKFVSKYLVQMDESVIGVNVTNQEFENDLERKANRLEREYKLMNDYRYFQEFLCNTKMYLYTGRIYVPTDKFNDYMYDKDCNLYAIE